MKSILCSLLLSLLVPVIKAEDLPDPRKTPGQANPAETVQTLCAKAFTTKDVRLVTEAQKRAIFAEYGIMNPKEGEWEIDHLILLELGGTNDNSNLWPQSYVTTPWNAHVKDKLETRLHWLICHGKVPLAQAQKEIAKDWIACYQKYISKTPQAKLPKSQK